MRVTEIRVYPVKSLAGVVVPESGVEPWGLVGDRRWALVDDAGEQVTAREVHALLGLQAEPVDEDTIRLRDRAGASILVDTPLGLPPVPVGISRQGWAAPADADVNEWITARVDRAVRLVWQEDPAVRRISGSQGGMPGEVLSLADAGPVLLTSQASLAQLNAWVAAESGEPDVADLDPDDLSDPTAVSASGSLDMLRFRPNVVVDGGTPFAEDAWQTVRIGDVDFRTTMVCDRCVMTTIDPETLAGGKEPIRTLARHRRWDRATWFGTRLVALRADASSLSGLGSIHVGDPVVPSP